MQTFTLSVTAWWKMIMLEEALNMAVTPGNSAAIRLFTSAKSASLLSMTHCWTVIVSTIVGGARGTPKAAPRNCTLASSLTVTAL